MTDKEVGFNKTFIEENQSFQMTNEQNVAKKESEDLEAIIPGRMNRAKYFYVMLIIGIVGGVLADREFKKAFDKSKDMENYINELDKLIVEKEGSIKISKIEIEKFKVPSGMLSSSIKVRTSEKKYEFNIGKEKNKVPELTDFLIANGYPIE